LSVHVVGFDETFHCCLIFGDTFQSAEWTLFSSHSRSFMRGAATSMESRFLPPVSTVVSSSLPKRDRLSFPSLFIRAPARLESRIAAPAQKSHYVARRATEALFRSLKFFYERPRLVNLFLSPGQCQIRLDEGARNALEFPPFSLTIIPYFSFLHTFSIFPPFLCASRAESTLQCTLSAVAKQAPPSLFSPLVLSQLNSFSVDGATFFSP